MNQRVRKSLPVLFALNCVFLLTMCGTPSGPGATDPDPESGQGGATEIILFTEYVEGSGNNKALEISNIGNASVNLSRCKVLIYANGGEDASYTIELNAVDLREQQCYVIAHSRFAEPARADQMSAWVNYNGDDAIALILDDEMVDCIGTIGHDPGDAWTGLLCTTQNATLRRKHIEKGDSEGTDSFDPDLEWEEYPLDDFTGLGS